jgi:uncharacterized protein (UPF0335 family)
MTEANISNTDLPKFVERLERLAEEKQELSNDMKDIMTEAKSQGHDLKALRRLLGERKKKGKNPDKWREEMDTFDVYAAALKLFE